MHSRRARRFAAGAALVLPLALAAQPRPQLPVAAPQSGALDQHPAIQYATRATTDRVSRLSAAIAAGSRTLARDAGTGYLLPLLDALGVPAESQLLVFSKTGIQRRYTSPARPRALYFDDAVVVGYNPGAPAIEIAAHDPRQGVIFYTLDQDSAPPVLTRRTSCLACHVSHDTLDVPGMIARSHFVDRDGTVIETMPATAVTHRTPHTQRWGGWFITANATAPRYSPLGHLGNLAVTEHPRSGPAITSDHIFVEWMHSDPESRGYPSSFSDLAAVMTFDHQSHAINLLTRLNWESRAGGGASIAPPVERLVSELADYLLFAGEAPLAVTVTPRAGFAASLASRTPKDRLGRSLGDFDLTTRLMRYPCSYMIYSDAFDALPALLKGAVYARIAAILARPPDDPRYRHLSPDTRRAILEILRDTRNDFPRS
jgi:hypothetical protein